MQGEFMRTDDLKFRLEQCVLNGGTGVYECFSKRRGELVATVADGDRLSVGSESWAHHLTLCRSLSLNVLQGFIAFRIIHQVPVSLF